MNCCIITNIFINYCNVTVTLYAYVLVCFLVPLAPKQRKLGYLLTLFLLYQWRPPLIKQILTQGPFSKPWSATVILSLNVNHTTGTDSWPFYFKCTNNLHRHSVSPKPTETNQIFYLGSMLNLT
jgi:hypothetical protein